MSCDARTLQRELEVCQNKSSTRIEALTLLGLPPRTLITRSLNFSISGRDTKDSTIFEYNRRDLSVANRHGSRERSMVALTPGVSSTTLTEAHRLSIVG